METSNLWGAEFITMAIRMLEGPRRRMDELKWKDSKH